MMTKTKDGYFIQFDEAAGDYSLVSEDGTRAAHSNIKFPHYRLFTGENLDKTLSERYPRFIAPIKYETDVLNWVIFGTALSCAIESVH